MANAARWKLRVCLALSVAAHFEALTAGGGAVRAARVRRHGALTAGADDGDLPTEGAGGFRGLLGSRARLRGREYGVTGHVRIVRAMAASTSRSDSR